FIFLRHHVLIISNIDFDHMSTYNNIYQTLIENFTDFVCKESVKSFYLCVDDQGCRYLLSNYIKSDKYFTSYGFYINADVQIYDYHI
ncbi:UDP-N-acetylmuramate--L-alanine ligase, partial [Francisella tularensis subsp. holarctica]|nr:UDP-N-acetylmuramate--L-alanine ligase [Francisella tularensis subsp. holarctica]